MLPSWRERLLISLAPGELSWVRLAGLLKPEVRAKRIVPVEPNFGARAWDGAVGALRAEAAQWQNDNLSVRIVLSNHFVRYALVPPTKGVSSADETLALARFHFAKVHGENSRGWDIRLSSMPSGAVHVACAVDSALLLALRASFPQTQRPRLASVQPLLMSVFNSGGSFIPDSGVWLVVAEADRTCVALLKGKTWHAIQNVKGRYSDVPAWINLVERERWRIPIDAVPDTILVHAPLAPALPNRTHNTWKVMGLQNRWPAGLQPARDGAYIQALSAA
ncbi:MAG TPA: hypothetical protein VK663_13095 [Burkholderiales bacterium]|nr:hypothetical protein [Burkholderiales bacterium]